MLSWLISALWTLGLALLSNAPASYGDDGGMKVSASVDISGSMKISDTSEATDRLDIREAEVLFYGPVDHIFDGLLSVAAHREQGVAVFEIHEAAIITSKLVPRSRLKLGQFFLGIGRLNRFHRHEWPFVAAPKVHAVFFGKEGVLDSGIEYSYLAPLPFFLDLTFGLTNGWVYGHSHNEGKKPRKPTHYARAGTYLSLWGGVGAQAGFNFLGRTSAEEEVMRLVGMDFVAKLREGRSVSFLLQAEAWMRTSKPKSSAEERTLGAYLYPQVALSESLFLGLRLDYYSILTLKNAVDSSISNADYAAVPTLTYKASEFSTLRVAYN